jgi:hypothetical protein
MLYASSDSRDLHLNLPAATYDALRACAEQRHQPATQLAQVAIEDWLNRQAAAELHRSIAEYAAACAGTADDLDEDWEAAGLESWEVRRHEAG